MSAHGRRRDHWSASLDSVESLRLRLAEVADRDEDQLTRELIAQVLYAKSSSFVALLDDAGRVLDINPAALISVGLDRAEVVGLPLWATHWWKEADDDVVRFLQRAVSSAFEGRLARFDVDVMQETAPRSTGTLDLVLRPLRGRDGQVAFVMAEGRSITDRKRMEQRLARQNAELSALTERLARVHDYRERLLADLSHDLRAPLNVVVTRAEQLLRSNPPEPIGHQVAGIRVAGLGALEQVNDMLEQVKADHGEVRLVLVDADLARAVSTVAEQFGPLAEDRDVELTVEAPDTLTARFDVERISRVVSNLLANAIRHVPPGGRILCSLAAVDGVAVLDIADSGPGVPPEHRERVFDRHRSGLGDGDGRSSSTGAGLGLAIVREFVELHGGTIELNEAPDGGALFSIALPLQPPTGEGASLAHHANAARRIEYVRSRLEADLATQEAPAAVPTVVIVERVPGRADTILAAIGDAAVTCVAEDAVEALRLAAELTPDALVVGTATGDMPAPSLLRRMASDERLASVRRVALAGEREEDPSPEALIAAGAQLVLPATAVEELGGRLWTAATAAGGL